MLSLFRSRVASRTLSSSLQLPSTSSLLSRSFLTHYTESEVIEQEDLVLNDVSSSSSSSASSSQLPSASSSASGLSASHYHRARASEPSESVKAALNEDDFNGADVTQRVLDTAGFTHSHLVQRVYNNSNRAA